MRQTLLGVAFLLAAIAELQWGATFLGDGETTLAIVLFIAGAGMLLASGGAFVPDMREWALWAGIAMAGAAHAFYFVQTLSFAPVLNLAAGLAAAGLLVAAWGAREELMWMRMGLAAAAVGGIVWTAWDVRQADMSFMVGNVFATIGWGLAAFTPAPKDA